MLETTSDLLKQIALGEDSTIEMKNHSQTRLIRFDEQVVPAASIDDLNPKLWNRFRTALIKEFVDELDSSLKKWLSFCLFGVLMMNSINWASFERAGFGGYKKAALS